MKCLSRWAITNATTNKRVDHWNWQRRSLKKHRVAFAAETHKDHRIQERVDALRAIDSECVGACVDTGNNFALLEDPLETARALAPWAHAVHLKDHAVHLKDQAVHLKDQAVHLKDQAVQPSDQGFGLARFHLANDSSIWLGSSRCFVRHVPGFTFRSNS